MSISSIGDIKVIGNTMYTYSLTMFDRLRHIYYEFPRTFWTLIGAMFIDQVGGALIFPFLSLYVTQKFNVGMVEVGILFAIYSAGGLIGSAIGGVVTDRFGRKTMILIGLIASAFTSLLLGFVNQLTTFYSLAGLVGLMSQAASPAHSAMVADLLPEEKRTQGFSILRVVANLAVTIGPMIGGLLIGVSYLLLFVIDAVASTVTAAFVFFALPETRPAKTEGQVEAGMGETFAGYRVVLADWVFMFFVITTILLTTISMQMTTTLPVFLRDVHGVPARGFGYLLSLNALMVVALQFLVTRRAAKVPPLVLMVAGSLLYAVGFAMFGFVASGVMFVLAVVIITFGEMLTSPTSQALVAHFAPADMRGRYMAVYGVVWIVPSLFAPLAAGYIMDNYNPNWVWYLGGIILVGAAAGYSYLHARVGKRLAGVSRAPL